ncbi:polysaccharide biosynthesis protein [Ornithinimicrobium sediminis]|uniref:polysaccharide biosynthesis protein n=1 Tax=Ornithinimicrobium sediminis TaxID=2904603 RepID=UPI001E4A09ED|nr:nucleoside-diphosphate sugar epimerase/dehydratase [Ornithinimicrobium sediminis]MCE0485982.1 polysaccharide biosynthesis protein [Ornithinimicrobium sediminis]
MHAAGGHASMREAAVRTGWALSDGLWWAGAVLVYAWVRYSYDLSESLNPDVIVIAATALIGQVFVGCALGPYLVNHIRGSFEEVVAVTRAALIMALGLTAWVALAHPSMQVPRSLPVVAGAVALIGMLASRFVVRTWRIQRAASRPTNAKVIVFGAGVAGRRLVYNMIHDDESAFRPVALVDDDRSKRKLRVEGVRVAGTREDIPRVAARTAATHLIVALPNADAGMMREMREISEVAGLQLKVLPTLNNLFSGNPQVQDLRDINLEDLLGRRAVELDQGAIADQVTGKVVLVTGAGGSIGAELCRQIARFQPARLLLLERDESALHSTQLSLTGRGLLEGEDLLLADIRDRETLRRLFRDTRPDVVFHAAALKHLSLLERHPLEAWQTNILGTLNVLTAAAESGVGAFVNISTDKAANPTSVLGYSKRIAERLTAQFAYTEPGRYVSVRFGNVLGSRGSVVPSFMEQIRRGGPVTVTHPDVERYFMLISEACQLVLQASAMGSDGDVMVLDMGQPVRIADVAQTLIDLSGRTDVDIVYTGLRPGEKLTEDLFTDSEVHEATGHELLTRVQVPALPEDAVSGPVWRHPGDLVDWMQTEATAGLTSLVPLED